MTRLPESLENSTEYKLKHLWMELVGAEPQQDTSFFTLAANSLDIVKLKQFIYREFEVDISISDLYKSKVFSEQLQHLNSLLMQKGAI
ncbi:acyl carrier protein [uncultured Shewanella sp.]|uniref:acyl carrier protein n=1 Tax=uncultured Shewanella sp. TaxID=173975 RepID=UPI00261C1911|nr:acyl carrier protein [uncultured Shewanella sp.]